jgi:hypothetical protein
MQTNDRIPAVMNMREQILAVSDRYGSASGIGRKRVSTIVLGRGSKLDDIAIGGDLLTAIFERAMQWFSDNWPDAAEWPDGVPRPEPEKAREAAE